MAEAGLIYECFCTRREIAEAPQRPARARKAPTREPAANLSDAEREERRQDRPAALRLRADTASYTVADRLHGDYTGVVDDFVLRRNDGVPAYNLAVVVDDAAQGVDQVVRGDDLLSSAPRQAYLARLLGLPPGSTPTCRWSSMPTAAPGQARRCGDPGGPAVAGFNAAAVRGMLLGSLGLPDVPLDQLAVDFRPDALPLGPWIFDPPQVALSGG